MSITRTEFRKSSLQSVTRVRVLEFLKFNQEKAFTIAEIATELGLTTGAVGSVMSGLAKANLVENKRPYWMIKIPL